MWSHGPAIEDRPTQHVRYSTSLDGLKWSEPKEIVGPSPREGFRYTARGLWVREGQLIALGSHDEALNDKGKVHYYGNSLQLLGFAWDGKAQQWMPLGVVFDKAMNISARENANGEWGMICRGPNAQHDVFMLTGGVASPSAWTRSPIVTETLSDDFRPNEPDWWRCPMAACWVSSATTASRIVFTAPSPPTTAAPGPPRKRRTFPMRRASSSVCAPHMVTMSSCRRQSRRA